MLQFVIGITANDVVLFPVNCSLSDSDCAKRWASCRCPLIIALYGNARQGGRHADVRAVRFCDPRSRLLRKVFIFHFFNFFAILAHGFFER